MKKKLIFLKVDEKSQTTEQLRRLAVAEGSSPIVLWNKISAIMTDSAAKNLKIILKIIEK